MKKKNAPTTNSSESAQDQAHSTPEAHQEARKAQFLGTENPRHLRALWAFMRRPMPREQLDREVGCSNGPDLVAELRRRGLEIPCQKAPVIDRDGQEVRRGIYHLTDADRRRLQAWLCRRARHA